MNKNLLQRNGWTIECESPFEIRHSDGSFATGQAANIIMQTFIEEQTIPFQRLDRLCRKHRTVFVLENNNDSEVITAVRCLNAFVEPLKSRTHNIRFYKTKSMLWWENEQSQEWAYQFSSPAEAQQWWDAVIMSKVVNNIQENKQMTA